MLAVGIEIVALLHLLCALRADSSDECRYTFTDSQGQSEIRTIDSDLDGNYDNNSTCDWTITTEQGKIVWLFILKFEVQTEDHCTYDNFKVYDGLNNTAPLLGTFCGDLRVNESCVPSKMRSSNNAMYMEFHSDANVTAGGIRAVFVSAEGNSWRRWPQGKYSIPMSIYGCPDQDLNNWDHGSYNITVSTDNIYHLEGIDETNSAFQWNIDDLILLGPFGEYTFQINFCTKVESADTRHVYEDDQGQRMYLDLDEWPRGEYGVFNAEEKLIDLYEPIPGRSVDIRCPKGFSKRQRTVLGIDSYSEYGRTPTSSFNCSTEYFVANMKIRYCILTFYVCMKHAPDLNVDRADDLRLPFMVLANVPETCHYLTFMHNITSVYAFLGENTSMKVVKEIVYPTSDFTSFFLSNGFSYNLYDYFDYCLMWFPLFAIVPKGDDYAATLFERKAICKLTISHSACQLSILHRRRNEKGNSEARINA